jgi:hypothetical protein
VEKVMVNGHIGGEVLVDVDVEEFYQLLERSRVKVKKVKVKKGNGKRSYQWQSY